MTTSALQQAARVVQDAAVRREGEKQAVAIERAAKFLGLSYAMAYALFYAREKACSVEKAREITAQRERVLLDRLDYETRRHQAETRLILAALNAETETECSNKPASALRRLFSASLSGSAVSPGEWQSADIEPDFAWDYGL
jgi:hypothetical protein